MKTQEIVRMKRADLQKGVKYFQSEEVMQVDDIRYIEIINKGGQVIFAPEASTIVINEVKKGEKN